MYKLSSASAYECFSLVSVTGLTKEEAHEETVLENKTKKTH